MDTHKDGHIQYSKCNKSRSRIQVVNTHVYFLLCINIFLLCWSIKYYVTNTLLKNEENQVWQYIPIKPALSRGSQ